MNTRKKWWLGAATLALLGWAGKAQALGVVSSTATLSIDVTVSGALSVNINSADSSTQTVTYSGANALMVSPSTVAVQNNSGILSERWKINSADAFDSTNPGGDPWTLVTTTAAVGADKFAIQAVFGSSNTATGSCPITTAADWNLASGGFNVAPALGNGVGTAITYQGTPTSATTGLADSTLTNNGSYQPDVPGTGYMYASSVRALCWRIVGPASVSATDSQIIPIMVTAY